MKTDKKKRSGPSKRRRRNDRLMMLAAILLASIIIIGVFYFVRKYAPSGEHLSLSEYYSVEDPQAIVITDGVYDKGAEEDNALPQAMVFDDGYYLELSYLKDKIDDGYVYDTDEHILRYATADEVITASLDSAEYTVGRNAHTMERNVVTSDENATYVSLDFITLFTDMTVELAKEPYRIVVELPGYEKRAGNLSKRTAVRRLGGPKSPILKDAQRGDELSILEEYGKWTKVLTTDGVIGYVRNGAITDIVEKTTERNLPEREYQHITMNEKVNLIWHQVMSTASNVSISGVLSSVEGVNVIAPTWFRLRNNEGGIYDIASLSYVNACHEKQIQVWGLVSNIHEQDDEMEVDSTAVLSSTSARDNLVNNLIGKAIAYNLDGINVDFEALSQKAADGYIQFIRELSIKCEKNDLVLSIDNYPPEGSNQFYNRKEQANYADYCIVMAYDEHYTGTEPGSNASLPFVKDAVEQSLEQIPAERLVLGMPFYAKIWKTDDSGSTNEAIAMKNIANYLKENKAKAVWDDTLGQKYTAFDKDGMKYELWIEDADSLALKLQVMKEQKLAGGAFWKEGFESSSIWSVIAGYMK